MYTVQWNEVRPGVERWAVETQSLKDQAEEGRYPHLPSKTRDCDAPIRTCSRRSNAAMYHTPKSHNEEGAALKL
jgi:hypothetical protein